MTATTSAHCPAPKCLVGADNDRSDGYPYPPRVRFEFHEKEIDSYRRAADFLEPIRRPATIRSSERCERGQSVAPGQEGGGWRLPVRERHFPCALPVRLIH